MSIECEWTNKSSILTNVFDTVNAPPPLPHTLDIDDRGGGVINVVWAMLPSVLQYLMKIHPLGIFTW